MSSPESQHYQELALHHDDVVPIVGAGLSVAAGVLDFPGLVDGLASRASAGQGDSVCGAVGREPFDVIDGLAAATSEEWIQQQTADLSVGLCLSRPPHYRR